MIEDRKLKAGVKKHGEGNWRMILNDFEFDNRTGVNLKDRWRTLKSKGEDFWAAADFFFIFIFFKFMNFKLKVLII